MRKAPWPGLRVAPVSAQVDRTGFFRALYVRGQLISQQGDGGCFHCPQTTRLLLRGPTHLQMTRTLLGLTHLPSFKRTGPHWGPGVRASFNKGRTHRRCGQRAGSRVSPTGLSHDRMRLPKLMHMYEDWCISIQTHVNYL